MLAGEGGGAGKGRGLVIRVPSLIEGHRYTLLPAPPTDPSDPHPPSTTSALLEQSTLIGSPLHSLYLSSPHFSFFQDDEALQALLHSPSPSPLVSSLATDKATAAAEAFSFHPAVCFSDSPLGPGEVTWPLAPPTAPAPTHTHGTR